MSRADLNDLQAFLAVARERSFIGPAAKPGVFQSALSQTIRGLEARVLRCCCVARTFDRRFGGEVGRTGSARKVAARGCR
jgi:DNA-binding transcriptional LysR family regulator